MMRILRRIATALLVFTPMAAHATQDGSSRANCLAHIEEAEARYEIPSGLLEAISNTESRHNPLAINRWGETYRPASFDAAAALLIDASGQPYQNVAIGCMQIFARYHLDEVDGDPSGFLDPEVNVDYAARLLLFLRDHTGTWRDAVGRYHTGPSSPNYERYICVIDRELRSVGSTLNLGCVEG